MASAPDQDKLRSHRPKPTRPSAIRPEKRILPGIYALIVGACVFLVQCPTPGTAAEGKQSPLTGTREASQERRDIAELAAAAMADKRFQEAAALYTQALAANPTRVDCLLRRGEALEMTGQTDKALQDYAKALEIDPSNAQAMVASATILEINPRGEAQALALLKKALPLAKDTDREKIVFSIAVLENRMEQESSSAVGCWNMGNRHLRRGKLDEAEAFFSRALELNPSFYQAYYSRGLVRLKKDHAQAALQDLSAAIALCPSLRGCLVARGLLYESQGMLPEAVADMKQAASVDARDPEAHYHLGRLQEKEGAYPEALSSYLEAMRWRPKPELRHAITQRLAILARSVKATPKSDALRKPNYPLW